MPALPWAPVRAPSKTLFDNSSIEEKSLSSICSLIPLRVALKLLPVSWSGTGKTFILFI